MVLYPKELSEKDEKQKLFSSTIPKTSHYLAYDPATELAAESGLYGYDRQPQTTMRRSRDTPK